MQDGTFRPEVPEGPVDETVAWGSDVAARMLRRLGPPYVALTPGASFRGLHDSLVNHLGNTRPEMLLCLHEEHAVAIAHGWAKATGQPLAVALHSNVGLMHATMAIFNAFCDRVPMLIVGATGPVDATIRRPWIDWLHTAQDQAALVRPFLKWDDQPGSIAAIPDAFQRAWRMTATAPEAPVYVCLDAALQETPVEAEPLWPDPARHAPAPPARPDAAAVAEAARRLAAAKRPLILMGRGRRTDEAWAKRVALAERLGAGMISDLKAGSMVPTDHPLHVGQPINKLSKPCREALREADAILSLGWIDLGGLLRQAFGRTPPAAAVIHAGQDLHLHNGWGKEHLEPAPIDVELLGDADAAVADLLAALPERSARGWTRPAAERPSPGAEGALTLRDVAAALKAAAGEQPVTFAALARSWPVDLWPHRDPLAFLGKDGGGGVGSGPGLAIGAALALADSGRLTVAVLGDGDALMGINAFWTAARHRIPLVTIVSNNRSYYNDELHQESVARKRGRNPANRWIGQRLDDPAPDIAAMARAQGVEAVGPVRDRAALEAALAEAVATARAGAPFLVDVHIDPGHGRTVLEASAERGG